MIKIYIITFFALFLLANHLYSNPEERKTLPNKVNYLTEPTVKDYCFSPTNQGAASCGSKIIDRINQANLFVVVAMYAFTDEEIAAALVRASLPPRNVPVYVMIDKKWHDDNMQYSEAVNILKNPGSRIVVSEKAFPDRRLFHHKVIVTGERFTSHDAESFSFWVATGSYNYTSAAKRNYENYVFINEMATSVDDLPETFAVRYLIGLDRTSSVAQNYLMGTYMNSMDWGGFFNPTQIQQAASQSGGSSAAMLYNLATEIYYKKK